MLDLRKSNDMFVTAQGKLLEESADKLNSINLLKHMTPIAAVTLLLLVMVIEPNVRDAIPTRESPDFVPFCVLLLLNGLLSFAVNLSNFLVTHYTSPLTLQVRPSLLDYPDLSSRLA